MRPIAVLTIASFLLAGCTSECLEGPGDCSAALLLAIKKEHKSKESCFNDASLRFQVDKLNNYMGSNEVSSEQRQVLANAITATLGTDMDLLVVPLTPESLGTPSASDQLDLLIYLHYADSSNRLKAFLNTLRSKMGRNYPLENYEKQNPVPIEPGDHSCLGSY